jgi:hypothetical protein
MFPPECQKTVALYHLPTTAGQKQPYPASADVTTTGAFLPMDRREYALEGGDLVDPFELYLDVSVDVRVNDKMVIDSATYFVKKVFNAPFGGLPHKRVSISTQP